MLVFTTTITAGNSFTVTKPMNILQISGKVADAVGSAGTIQGSLQILSTASTAITLAAGDSFTLGGTTQNSPIEGLVISCTTGTIQLMATVN